MTKQLTSIEDTRAYAEALVQRASAQMSPYTIALEGEIGVGKTELVRQALRSMGYQDPVQSPTFYRLFDTDELSLTGWDEEIEKADIAFVEWAAQVQLECDCTLKMHMEKGQRFITEI
jgi:tRNA A37 threonylcarbamoyladenosine biosynthesis protein TsaE